MKTIIYRQSVELLVIELLSIYANGKIFITRFFDFNFLNTDAVKHGCKLKFIAGIFINDHGDFHTWLPLMIRVFSDGMDLGFQKFGISISIPVPVELLNVSFLESVMFVVQM
ncbi:hypothetical protein D3C87_1704120 [compost metagenome]